MRDFPRLMAEAGLSLTSARSDALLEVGSAEFFKTMVEADQFFGSCNFVTYVSKPN